MHPETVSSQEVPDYCGERTEAKALGDLEGLARAESDVKQRTRAWVKRKGAEEDQNWRPRKRHRLSSAQWLSVCSGVAVIFRLDRNDPIV